MTEDGSFTLKREDLNETYHSLDGAIGESQHVYIENGLLPASYQKNKLRVFEFGFYLFSCMVCPHVKKC